MRVAPDEPPDKFFRIGVDEELVRIEAQPTFGLVRPMHPVSVELSRGDVVEVAVPDILGTLRQRDTLDLTPAMTIEEAQFNFLRVSGKQGEIRSASVPGRSQRMRRPGRNPHATAPEREKLQQGAEQQG